jgi:hypothetical protein
MTNGRTYLDPRAEPYARAAATILVVPETWMRSARPAAVRPPGEDGASVSWRPRWTNSPRTFREFHHGGHRPPRRREQDDPLPALASASAQWPEWFFRVETLLIRTNRRHPGNNVHDEGDPTNAHRASGRLVRSDTGFKQDQVIAPDCPLQSTHGPVPL